MNLCNFNVDDGSEHVWNIGYHEVNTMSRLNINWQLDACQLSVIW